MMRPMSSLPLRGIATGSGALGATTTPRSSLPLRGIATRRERMSARWSLTSSFPLRGIATCRSPRRKAGPGPRSSLPLRGIATRGNPMWRAWTTRPHCPYEGSQLVDGLAAYHPTRVYEGSLISVRFGSLVWSAGGARRSSSRWVGCGPARSPAGGALCRALCRRRDGPARTEDVPLRQLVAVPGDVGKSSAMVMACDFTRRTIMPAREFPLTRRGIAGLHSALPTDLRLVRVG